ncbi:MAG: 3-oxocholest-4-en-26-oyl-CoA dehydrogenase beta subunit [Pseudonocardiales bacterium]|nr:3-oxocholest-4-en-26-oyl-CoA dehydrogenase beta subunit [Pseudonocardiales bacterium]
MDFELSESQLELAALARQILDDQVTPERLRAAEDQHLLFDRALWQALAKAGVVSAALPASIGGGGLDFLEQCSVLIELGRSTAPVPYLTSVLSAAALGFFGTDDQRTRWAAPAAAGELVLTAALAEELLDDAEAPQTRAERAGDGWRLAGSKAVVPYGSVADAFLVPAATDDGPALFVVLPDDAGVSLEEQRLVDGDTAVTLDLSSVEVPADRLVPGADVVHWLVARATVALAAYQTGVLERALELSAEYAREREQFGRPIGSFQAVAQRLADAYIDVEAVRLTMWEAAWRIHNALSGGSYIATAKFWAADAGHRVAHTAVHVHGGTGIDMDAATHRYFTAAKRTEFALGGATAHLRRLGAELAATPV